jgi:pseudaminic acid biosynthesis-associated methylase
MNEQEKFWQGKFGDNYTKRNSIDLGLVNNISFFKKILKNIKINSLIELGANNGSNILAIKKVKKKLNNITAVEINLKACKELEKIKCVNVINQSISKLKIKKKFDFVLLKGVLIHINPNQLKKIYEKISKLSNKYVLIAEFYNPYPIKIDYRNFKNKLFKRDFAGEFIANIKNFKIIDYGFAYRKDKFPQEDLTWFLIRKST